MVHSIFRFNYNKQETWAGCSVILPHAISVAEYGDKYGIELERSSWLYNEAAIYLHLFMARYNEAEPLFKRAMDIYEKVFGANNDKTAAVLNNLAFLYEE